jgi:ABC-type sugar transport system substrate-binding protein
MEADLCLDMTAGARFTHKTMTEQVEFLENFIAKHASIIRTNPPEAKVMSSVEESASVESKPIASLDSTHEPSPKP